MFYRLLLVLPIAGVSFDAAYAQGKNPPTAAAAASTGESAKPGAAKKKAADAARLQTESFASKLPASLEETPAILTVYSNEYVRDFAFLTLSELLQTTPGFNVSRASWFDVPRTRGLGHTSLLMIDGTPINSHVSNFFPAGEQLSLWNYKRIEVISGPGGVLWGSHSLLGVVNLISYDGADIDGVRLAAEVGSHGRQRYLIQGGGRWRDIDGFLGLSFTTYRGEGAAVENATTSSAVFGGSYTYEAAPAFTEHESDRYFEVVGKLSYGGLSLFSRIPVARNYYEISEEGGVVDYGDNGYRQSDDWLVYARWVGAIPEANINLLAKTYLYRNVVNFNNRMWSGNSQFPNGFGQFLEYGLALRLGAVAEAGWNLDIGGFASNQLGVGTDVYRESISGAQVSETDDSGLYVPPRELVSDAGAIVASAYVYDTLRVWDRIAISGGLRYNWSETYQSAVLLSGAAVVRLFSSTYLKGNLTNGMRPPTMAERFGKPPYSAPLGDYLRTSGVFPMGPTLSTAYQVELLTSILKGVGPFVEFQVRGDLAITSVEGERALISSSFDPGTLYYMPTVEPKDILSAESRLDALLKGGHRAWLSYSYNKITFQGAESLRVVPQSGPKHMFSFGLSASVLPMLQVFGRGTVTTGDTGALLRPEPGVGKGGDVVLTDVDTRVLLSGGVNVPNVLTGLVLSLAVHNILDQRQGYFALSNVYENVGLQGQTIRYPEQGLSVMGRAVLQVW